MPDDRRGADTGAVHWRHGKVRQHDGHHTQARGDFQAAVAVLQTPRPCFSVDHFPNPCENVSMIPAALDYSVNAPEALADEEAVMASFVSGKPLDPEIAKRVRERGRQIREEIFRQHGLLDIGVPAIRELRGELPNP